MTITMNLPINSYDIIVERGILAAAGKYIDLNRKVLIITDDGVPEEYYRKISEQCLHPVCTVLPQGENTKSFKSLEKLCRIMLENNFSRKDCVVAVGGGVIGDLSGFAASCYMRGIDFYNIPTTLLSQVDSSIGGKCAINLDSVKNIVGAFYQPKKVLIDADVLNSLPDRQLSNGLAEAVKMSLTNDKELFELIEKGNVKDNIEQIIIKSLLIKKSVVEADEKENSVRRILNFGHTIGHAFETLNMGKLYHGECVALGMIPMCAENVKSRLIDVLKANNLPTDIKYDKNDVLEILQHDKKAEGETVFAIFVDNIGSCRIEKISVKDFEKLL